MQVTQTDLKESQVKIENLENSKPTTEHLNLGNFILKRDSSDVATEIEYILPDKDNEKLPNKGNIVVKIETDDNSDNEDDKAQEENVIKEDATANEYEYLSTSNTRIRKTEENSYKSSERGDKGQSIDVTHKQTNETRHKCDDCGEGFNQTSKLIKHKRIIHNDLKPFKCDICGEAFRRSTYLISHRLIHTGEKPHKCDICSKAFRWSTHLIRHRLIHTGEKPHKCDICGKAFRRSTYLIRHRLIHTGENPHKCDICGKAFRQSTHLIQHRLIHTGEKPHKCDICGRAFTRKAHLERHKHTH